MYKKLLFSVFTILLCCQCSPKITTVHQKTPHIKTYTYKKANIHLVFNGDDILMIDTGNPNELALFEKTLAKENIDITKIKYIILTHAHYDHAGNASALKDKYNIPIIVGKPDLTMIKENGHDPHLCANGFYGWLLKPFAKHKNYTSFTPDILIDTAFDLNTIGFKGKIIPYAGHTPGSIIIEIGTAVFVGDLIRGSFFKNNIPKTHAFMCDAEENMKMIQQLASSKKYKKWYLGHSGYLDNEDVLNFVKKRKD